jgi:hypothetical protein
LLLFVVDFVLGFWVLLFCPTISNSFLFIVFRRRRRMPSTVSLPFRSSDLCWEQCARFLLTLSLEESQQLRTTINLILQNIVNHVHEEKYRRLKTSNASLQRKVFSHPGGTEILLSLGFVWQFDEEAKEKILVFPMLPAQEHEGSDALQRIHACRHWLQNTIETCERIVMMKRANVVDAKDIYVAGEEEDGAGAFTSSTERHRLQSIRTTGDMSLERESIEERRRQHELAMLRADGHHLKANARERQAQQQSSGDYLFVPLTASCPADALIMLQLPTGRKVTGGFMLGDELLQVYRFACSFFDDDRSVCGISLSLSLSLSPSMFYQS